MQLVGWLVLAWVAGIAAILGSLMALAGIVLCLIPPTAIRDRKGGAESEAEALIGRNRLKLLVASGTIAIAGLTLLLTVPFPHS